MGGQILFLMSRLSDSQSRGCRQYLNIVSIREFLGVKLSYHNNTFLSVRPVATTVNSLSAFCSSDHLISYWTWNLSHHVHRFGWSVVGWLDCRGLVLMRQPVKYTSILLTDKHYCLEEKEMATKILHVMGSPLSSFDFDLRYDFQARSGLCRLLCLSHLSLLWALTWTKFCYLIFRVNPIGATFLDKFMFQLLLRTNGL